MKPSDTSTAQKLTRARVQLLLGQPFFGTLSLRLKLLPGSLPTMATDGSRIVYSPAFVDELKPAELEGTLAHEVLHCALGHQCRRGNRDPELWNEAADLAINPILIGNGFTLPVGALFEPGFENLSAEEIYARLLRRRSEQAGEQSRSRRMLAKGPLPVRERQAAARRAGNAQGRQRRERLRFPRTRKERPHNDRPSRP